MILCLGTTPTMQRTMLFDRVRIDGVNRATEVREYASGKSVNVAKVLKTLGNNALATGFVGGPRGGLITQHLNQAGAPHDFVIVDHNTRLCTTIIDRESGNVTELVEESGPVASENWQELNRKLERFSRTPRRGCFPGR